MNPIQTLQRLLSEQYIPAGPADLIGPTHRVALKLDGYVDAVKDNGEPLRLMLSGPPGVAKTALIRYVQRQLGVNPKWSTFKFSGVDVSVDRLRDVSQRLQGRDMFSPWRIIWIEEADQIPKVAQVRFLQLLDELPPYTAVLCTSNVRAAAFETRFQTRFTFPVPFIEAPTGKEIHQFIVGKIGRDLPTLATACEFAAGNVRAAINDAIDLLIDASIPKAA